MPNKAELESYTESPFFKPDPSGVADFVAWAGDAMHQELLFWTRHPMIADRIDYLFKEHIGSKEDEMLWRRVAGGIFRDDLAEVIRSDSELIFMIVVFSSALALQRRMIILPTTSMDYSGYTRRIRCICLRCGKSD